MSWTCPQAASLQESSQGAGLQAHKSSFKGALSRSPIYPKIIYSVSLKKPLCVCVCVCVCVCWPRGSVQLGGRWGRGRNGSNRSFVKAPSLSQSLRAPHTWTLSEFCYREHSGSPCSTLCLYPIKRLSSFFHLPETCNSHSIPLPKPLLFTVHSFFEVSLPSF